MVRRRRCVLVIAVLVASCTGGGSTGTSAPLNPGSGGTLRVGMTGPAYTDLDPQNEMGLLDLGALPVLPLRTLMSYGQGSGCPTAGPLSPGGSIYEAGTCFFGSMNGIEAVVPARPPSSAWTSSRWPGSASPVGTQT
jgi:hypothetical protein